MRVSLHAGLFLRASRAVAGWSESQRLTPTHNLHKPRLPSFSLFFMDHHHPPPISYFDLSTVLPVLGGLVPFDSLVCGSGVVIHPAGWTVLGWAATSDHAPARCASRRRDPPPLYTFCFAIDGGDRHVEEKNEENIRNDEEKNEENLKTDEEKHEEEENPKRQR